MSSIGKAVKFPPVTFFIALVIGFAALQGYFQYAGAGETQEVLHLEPTISTDSDTYHLGSTVKIMVMVAEGHEHGAEGHDDDADGHEHEEGAEEGHEHEEEESADAGHQHEDDEEAGEGQHQEEEKVAEEGHQHDDEEAAAEGHEHEEEAAEGHHHDDEDRIEGTIRITIYAPDGNIFAIKENELDHDGMATFEINIGSENPVGTYTISAESIFEELPTVISETVAIEVVD